MNQVYIPTSWKKQTNTSFVDGNEIMEIVQDYFGVTRETLMVKSKKQTILYPRQVCVWLLSKYSSHSLSSIGELFGQKDHTSARNSVQVIDDYLTYNDEVKKQINLLSAKVEEALPPSSDYRQPGNIRTQPCISEECCPKKGRGLGDI